MNPSLHLKKQLQLDYKFKAESLQEMMEELLLCLNLQNFNIMSLEWASGLISLRANSKKMSILLSVTFADIQSISKRSLENTSITIEPPIEMQKQMMEENKEYRKQGFQLVQKQINLGELANYCDNYEF